MCNGNRTPDEIANVQTPDLVELTETMSSNDNVSKIINSPDIVRFNNLNP